LRFEKKILFIALYNRTNIPIYASSIIGVFSPDLSEVSLSIVVGRAIVKPFSDVTFTVNRTVLCANGETHVALPRGGQAKQAAWVLADELSMRSFKRNIMR
jgi:hypothetical protein